MKVVVAIYQAAVLLRGASHSIFSVLLAGKELPRVHAANQLLTVFPYQQQLE